MFKKYLLLGGAMCAVGMGFYACDFAQGPSSTRSSSPSTGTVDVTVDLGKLGVAGRNASPDMTPKFVKLVFTSNIGTDKQVRDSFTVTGTGDIFSTPKQYTLASERTWTLGITVKDKFGIVMFQGSKKFNVYAAKTTSVNVGLDAEYSYLNMTTKLPDSTYLITTKVDGRIWNISVILCNKPALRMSESGVQEIDPLTDSVLMEAADSASIVCQEPAVAGRSADFNFVGGKNCTLTTHHSYLKASAAGVKHTISLEVWGRLWGMGYKMYEGSDTVLVQSGVSSSNKVITLPYVGPQLPPDAHPSMQVHLNEIGTLSFTTAYDSANFMPSHFDP